MIPPRRIRASDSTDLSARACRSERAAVNNNFPQALRTDCSSPRLRDRDVILAELAFFTFAYPTLGAE